jgi:dienelactone hydrolase
MGIASRGAAPAAGRFPLVLFSHGLRGTPERYAPAAASWAAAGFVVAAPAYPHTNEHAKRYNRADMVNQPSDAAYVIKKVRRLDRKAGDPLSGHIDVDRVAAVGHSAGGYTTTGLFAGKHPAWLRAGVVIAGWLAPGEFAGTPATMLFLRGDHDTVVPPARGRAAYDAVPWVKSFVLLPDSGHADYMVPAGQAYPEMDRLIIDFLRWTLNGEAASFPAGKVE